MSTLLPLLLTMAGMDSLNKPGGTQNANQLTQHGDTAGGCGGAHGGMHGAGVQGMDAGQTPVMDSIDTGTDSAMNFDASSVGGVNGVDGGDGVQPTGDSSDPSFDPNAQQTTSSSELDDMMEFMRSCIAKMEQMKAEQQNGGSGGAMPGLPQMGAVAAAAAPTNTSGIGGTGGAQSAPAMPASMPATQSAAVPGQSAAQPATPEALPATQNTPSLTAESTDNKPAGIVMKEKANDTTETNAAAKTGETSNGPSKNYTLDGGGDYTQTLVNNTGKAMDVAYVRNAGPGMSPGFDGTNLKVHLEPGESAKVSVPNDWQGRVQKFSGELGKPGTWGEFNNENKTGEKTWFDVSNIPGADVNMTMTAGDGTQAGNMKTMLEAAKKAPNADELLTKNAQGEDIFKPAQGFDGKTNEAVVKFMTEYEPQKAQDNLNGTANGKYDNYILPNNDSATRNTSSKEMTIAFSPL